MWKRGGRLGFLSVRKLLSNMNKFIKIAGVVLQIVVLVNTLAKLLKK